MTREEAIEILKKNKPTSDPRLCGKELCQACDMAIAALQEPERKHGKWEDYGNYFSQCSLCRYPVNYFWGKTKFCPNCGAIMDLSDEGDVND